MGRYSRNGIKKTALGRFGKSRKSLNNEFKFKGSSYTHVTQVMKQLHTNQRQNKDNIVMEKEPSHNFRFQMLRFVANFVSWCHNVWWSSFNKQKLLTNDASLSHNTMILNSLMNIMFYYAYAYAKHFRFTKRVLWSKMN